MIISSLQEQGWRSTKIVKPKVYSLSEIFVPATQYVYLSVRTHNTEICHMHKGASTRRYLRRGNFFTSRVHLNLYNQYSGEIFRSPAKYSFLPESCHWCSSRTETSQEPKTVLASSSRSPPTRCHRRSAYPWTPWTASTPTIRRRASSIFP